MEVKKILIVLICVSCAPEIVVHTDFDRSIEIHRNTSYAWLNKTGIESRNNPAYMNELTDKRVKTAVDRELSVKGYTRSGDAAQLIVHYHIMIENRTTVATDPYGYHYGSYWMRKRTDVFRYREGTLIIDFMDSRNCNLIWRGSATSVLDEDDMITEKTVNEAIAKIFKAFPFSAAREAVTP
jgi:hypothetical protein